MRWCADSFSRSGRPEQEIIPEPAIAELEASWYVRSWLMFRSRSFQPRLRMVNMPRSPGFTSFLNVIGRGDRYRDSWLLRFVWMPQAGYAVAGACRPRLRLCGGDLPDGVRPAAARRCAGVAFSCDPRTGRRDSGHQRRGWAMRSCAGVTLSSSSSGRPVRSIVERPMSRPSPASLTDDQSRAGSRARVR